MHWRWLFATAITQEEYRSLIALLRGLVVSRESDSVILDVGGVGYRVFMPSAAIFALGGGEEVTVHIHTHVREDALQLFGFAEETDRAVFLALTTVTGIGPKLAMSIMSGTTREELLTAVVSADVKRLTQIPNVGKKTAQRILVELTEVFKHIEPGISERASTGGKRPKAMADVASALSNLGYRNAHIEKTIIELENMSDIPNNFDDILREALRLIR